MGCQHNAAALPALAAREGGELEMVDDEALEILLAEAAETADADARKRSGADLATKRPHRAAQELGRLAGGEEPLLHGAAP